jgi:transposase
MDKLRSAIKKALTTDLSNTDIAKSCGVSRNTVKRYRRLAAERGYDWPMLADLSDDELYARFNSLSRCHVRKRMPDLAQIHAEKQQKAVDLTQLWEEYADVNPDDHMSYSQFTEHYRRYVDKLDLSMRQTHMPGQKAFVDFSGLRPAYTNPETGEVIAVELFVGVLGYSKLTFALCVASQRVPDWIEAHNRMFAYFGGVSAMTVPDNLKSAVIKPGPEPTLNRNYADLGDHYETVIQPARPRRPKDKAHAELGVRLAQRWLLGPLRKRQFFSLAEINEAMAPLLEKLNNRPFKKLPGSRRSRFEETERQCLLPLPAAPFEFAEWAGPFKLDRSYHILVQGHWYSAPHTLVGQSVSARVCGAKVEIFHRHVRVAWHDRSYEEGETTTDDNHRPESHRAYAGRSPENYRNWAQGIGPNLLRIVQRLLDIRVPAMAFPACDGLRKLASTHGTEAIEAAAARAVEINSLTAKTVRSLLSSGRYRQPRTSDADSAPIDHANIRGGSYYR